MTKAMIPILGNGCLLRGGSKLTRSVLFDYTRVNAGCEFKDVIASPQYVVDREGHTFYQGEEGTTLRWGMRLKVTHLGLSRVEIRMFKSP